MYNQTANETNKINKTKDKKTKKKENTEAQVWLPKAFYARQIG